MSPGKQALSLAFVATITAMGCRSIAPDDGGAPARAAIARERGSSRIAAVADDAGPAHAEEPITVEPSLAWGTRPPKDGILFPIVDGMCIHGAVYPLENGVLFAYGSSRGAYSRGGATTTARVTDAGLAPQPNMGPSASFDFWGVTAMGGHYPDRLWAVVDTSSRMVEASELRAGTAKAEDWKIILGSGAKFGDAGNAATENVPVRSFGKPLRLADGSVLLPERSVVRRDGADTLSHAFRAIASNGSLVAKPNVPGADLAEIAMGEKPRIAALANGEIVGVRSVPVAEARAMVAVEAGRRSPDSRRQDHAEDRRGPDARVRASRWAAARL
jgi:hypothetical protein